MESLHKKHEMRTYDFCYGMATNWADMDTGKFYHIQEYREAIDKGEHPDGIRVTMWGDPEQKTVEIVGPYTLRERMKEKEPDPRY